MSIFLMISYVCLVLVSGFERLTNTEVETILSLLKYLKIGECFLVNENINGTTVNILKKFTINSIVTGFIRVTDLKLHIKHSSPPDVGIAIIIKVKESEAVKELINENFKRLSWFTWLLISNDGLDEGIRIPFNCQFFVLENRTHRTIQITEKYHLKNSPVFSNNFGEWSPGRGLNTTSVGFYDRRMNMNGIEMTRTDSADGMKCNRYTLEREVKIVWADLSKIFNFSLKVVDDNFNETSTDDNTPDGSTCVYVITRENTKKDWIFSNFGIYLRLTTKFRSSSEVGWRAYVDPLKNEIWTAIGVWLVLSTAVIIIVQGCTRKAIYSNIFIAFFCLCNSDPMTTHPAGELISMPSQLVYLTMLIVPAVIIPAYSAFILATLSIVLPVEPFTDLKSFIEDGTFKLSTINSTKILKILKETVDPDLKYINDNLFVGPENTMASFLDLFELLCNNNYLAGLFLDTKSFRELFKCRMFVMQQEVISISSGFLLKKDSPLKKLFNEMLAGFREKGVMYKLQAIKQNAQSHQGNFEGNTNKLDAINMSQVSAIFLLIPLGITMSLVILMAEIVFYKKKVKCRKLLNCNLSAVA